MSLPTSRRVVAIEDRTVGHVTLPLAGPSGLEATIEITACALCTWELRVYAGDHRDPRPFLAGHEVAGDVVASGDESVLPLGTQVAARLLATCGGCRGCHHGQQCERMGALAVDTDTHFGPAGLADYLTLPLSALHTVDGVSPAEAALVEPLACVVRSVDKANLAAGDEVVVFGAGLMGQLHARLATAIGCHVHLLESDPHRRADTPGALAPTDDVDGYLRAAFITGGGAAAVRRAAELLAPGGTIVGFAAEYPPVPLDIPVNTLHHRELRMVGTVAHSPSEFARAAKLIADRLIPVADLVSARFAFEAAADAFAAATQARYRVVVTR